MNDVDVQPSYPQWQMHAHTKHEKAKKTPTTHKGGPPHMRVGLTPWTTTTPLRFSPRGSETYGGARRTQQTPRWGSRRDGCGNPP
mmetsp:Transcript_18526/g.34953  ORF Transcript_18526/g.34953 Transcript_18526/m.34953 type:complete len:85 (+) Transcript_18526:785-1039(+)